MPPTSTEKSEKKAITQRAGLIASGTLVSRILGAIRDAVIAASFTVGLTDAFFVAFTIPNTLRALLAEGAVTNAVIPVLSEVKETKGKQAASQFYRALTGSMLLILFMVCLCGVVFAPQLVTLYAAGFKQDPQKFLTTIQLARIVFPFLFFVGVAALAMGALHTFKRFFVPAFAPTFFNLCMISAPFALAPLAMLFGLPAIHGLAFGALLGGFLQGLVQLPTLARIGMFHLPRLNFRDPYVRKVLRLMAPLTFGISVYEINILLTRLFASYLPSGSQSYLFYGQRLVEIPQGMFALAIASATLPTLASLRNQGLHQEAKQTFSFSLRMSLFVSIPASVALATLAEPTVTVFFGRGVFETKMVQETSYSLVFMACGVWAIASIRNVVQMFFAYNDTRTPVLGSTLNLIVFAVASFLLMGQMRHMGIAAATSLGAVAQLTLLLILLHRKIGSFDLIGILKSVIRCVTASSVMAILLIFISSYGKWERGGNDPVNLLVYFITLLAGGAAFFVIAFFLGSPELKEILKSISRKTGTQQ